MTTGNQYLYDGEGRICAVLSPSLAGGSIMTGYIYDADGTRVAKGSISTWGSCDPAVNGFHTTSDYVLGPSGEQVTEMGISATPTANCPANTPCHQHTNVWAGGKLLATYDDNGLHFYLDDPLGTRRVQTDYAGVVEQSCTSLPYGDGESCTPTPTEHLFTGKERDTESGNDYFDARYYSSAMGRSMSPDFNDYGLDPAPVPWADYANPQSLNLYAYVRNNPLSRIDDFGHDVQICDNNGACSKPISNDAYKAAQQAQNQGGLSAPTLDQVGNSKDANGNFTAVAITSTDANGKTTQVGTATYVPDDHSGLDPYVGNNGAGIRTIQTAGATMGSFKGIATFFGASFAAAACVVGCEAAAVLIPNVTNSAILQVMAYLESQGIPATAAAAMALKMTSQVGAGKLGWGSSPRAANYYMKLLAPQINQTVREYRQSQGAH
jgi:RHS repeat-associated protein